MRKFFKHSILFILTLLSLGILSCGAQKRGMMYLYSDQNNNRFQITASEIRYIPMTASESSSGQYNGGKKATVKITKETFNQISTLAEAVFASEGVTTQRRMLTAVLSLQNNGENRQVIATPSEERKRLEAVLRELIQ